ncbi:hypothetical protein [Streptomyces sp. NPDC101234]|uniref:hypothetical protein n=1 Tax=Streptomyces sp. NPDC101234 TaxID=3366138 RepID=UPI003815705A
MEAFAGDEGVLRTVRAGRQKESAFSLGGAVALVADETVLMATLIRTYGMVQGAVAYLV